MKKGISANYIVLPLALTLVLFQDLLGQSISFDGDQDYVNVNTVELLVLESATTFDGNDTRFFASVDKFIELDAGDKYIKFPQVGVFR